MYRVGVIVLVILGLELGHNASYGEETSPGTIAGTVPRVIPRPLAHHPGNVFLEGEVVRVSLPAAGKWSLYDAEDQMIKRVACRAAFCRPS